MKFVQAFLCAAVCGVAFSFGTTVQAQTKPGYATVVRITGEARYSKGNNEWFPLVVGQTLQEGSIVQSARDSGVDIVLGEKIAQHFAASGDHMAQPAAPAALPEDGVRGYTAYKATAHQNVIHLGPNTVLAIDRLTVGNTGVDAVSDTELDLRQGTIFGNVKKLSAASQYLIKVPNGIAGVRGTTFSMSATGAITVINGSMVLSTVGPNGPVTVVLGPGDQYDPTTGLASHLSQQQFVQAQQASIEMITVVEGTFYFADDRTVVYVSPTRGRPPGVPPGPPFAHP